MSPCSIFTAILFLLAGCNQPDPVLKWSAAEIDPNLVNNPVYRKLDTLPEVMSMGDVFENKGPLQRSSEVAYLTQNWDEPKDSPRIHANNCRAYIKRTDTLRISIGIGWGFGADGFTLFYHNSRFAVKPYHFTDTHMDGQPEPVYFITRQNLVLDKAQYKLDDSLYGHIEFEAKEINELHEWVKHRATGYFRARVIEYPR
jgi:hypothetical protein